MGASPDEFCFPYHTFLLWYLSSRLHAYENLLKLFVQDSISTSSSIILIIFWKLSQLISSTSQVRKFIFLFICSLNLAFSKLCQSFRRSQALLYIYIYSYHMCIIVYTHWFTHGFHHVIPQISGSITFWLRNEKSYSSCNVSVKVWSMQPRRAGQRDLHFSLGKMVQQT